MSVAVSLKERRQETMKKLALGLMLLAALAGCQAKKSDEPTVKQLGDGIDEATKEADGLLKRIVEAKLNAEEADRVLQDVDAARMKLYDEKIAPKLAILKAAREAEDAGKSLPVGGKTFAATEVPRYRAKVAEELSTLEKRYGLLSADVAARTKTRDEAASHLKELEVRYAVLRGGIAKLDNLLHRIQNAGLVMDSQAAFKNALEKQKALEEKAKAMAAALTFKKKWYEVRETDYDRMRKKYRVTVPSDGKAEADAAQERWEKKKPKAE